MTREELLQKGKRKVQKFTLPDGEILHFRKASVGAFNLVTGFKSDSESGKPDFSRMIHLLIECLCDESGKPMFTPEQFDDIAELELDYVVTVIKAMGESRVNGQPAEELIKNSEASQTADLVSA